MGTQSAPKWSEGRWSALWWSWGRIVAVGLLALSATTWTGVGRASADGDGGSMPNGHPQLLLPQGPSLNWAGYAVETNLALPRSGAVSDVKGQWTVPSLTCGSSSTSSSAWIGIDGYANGTVEQVGTEHDCLKGRPYYAAWWEMYPSPKVKMPLPVHPGNVISTEVEYVGNSTFVLSLKNLSTGGSFSTTQKGPGMRQSAEWIVEAPYDGGVLPLANFGTITISHASVTINGHTGAINDLAWQNSLQIMDTPLLTIKAQPSLLGGSAFSVAWKHS